MAVAQSEKKPRVDPKKILEMADARHKQYAARDKVYDICLSYYQGNAAGRGGGKDLPVMAMNSQGRPTLRQVGETINADRTYSSQRLAPVVDDYAALLGRMPTSRVEAPDSSEQGQAKAELLTKYLIDTHELSDMDRQQAEAGFNLSCMGDTVYLLEPEPDLLRVVWSSMSPRYCYPSFYRGYRRFQLYDLIVQYQWDVDSIEREFGYKPQGEGAEHTTVTMYVSPYQRTVVIGTEKPVQGPNAEWDLGFCPAQWVFNKVNGQMAASDIVQSLTHQDFLDFAFNVLADGLVFNTYPMIGVKNPQNVGENLVVGPGAPPAVLGPDGDIVVRQTQGDIQAAMALIQQTISDLNTSTGSSAVRQEGQMHGSIITGRAVQSVQGPQSTRIEYKQGVLGAAIQELNAYTLAMQELAPKLQAKPVKLFRGKYKGKSFNEEMDPEKDIDGWYRNVVTWDQLVGMSLQQRVQLAYEGKVAKLWDDLQAAELVGVEDPIGMRNRIEAQMVWEAKTQAQVQEMVGGGSPPAEQPQPHMGRGGAITPPHPAPRAQMVMRPPQMATPPDSPQGPPPKDKIRSALLLVADKLRGEVWLISPDAIVPRLAITDARDYTTVLDAARVAMPGLKVRQVDEDKMPAGAQRLV